MVYKIKCLNCGKELYMGNREYEGMTKNGWTLNCSCDAINFEIKKFEPTEFLNVLLKLSKKAWSVK